MPQYHVDSEQIHGASVAINNSADQIRSAVTSMYSQLTQLEGTWTGSAASQFTSVMQEWQTAQRTMEQSLQSIHNALVQAAAVYSDAEVQASQLFAQ